MILMRDLGVMLFYIAISLASFSQKQANLKAPGFHIIGAAPHFENKKVYLLKRKNDGAMSELVKTDSCLVSNGRFTFKGRSLNFPEVYFLTVGGVNGFLEIFIENKMYTINLDKNLQNSVVNGGQLNQELVRHRSIANHILSPLKIISSLLLEAQRNNDSSKIRTMDSLKKECYKQLEKFEEDVITSNQNKYLSLFLAQEVWFQPDKSNELKNFLATLPTRYKSSPYYEVLHQRLINWTTFNIGKALPLMRMGSSNGNHFTYADTEADYILIDFWASWCMPCRKANLSLKHLYDTYKTKGFEIVSVSLDENKELWKTAIAKDGISWINVSELNGWKNSYAKLLGITELPSNFLVDKNFKIIAKNSSPDKLEEILSELFNAK